MYVFGAEDNQNLVYTCAVKLYLLCVRKIYENKRRS